MGCSTAVSAMSRAIAAFNGGQEQDALLVEAIRAQILLKVPPHPQGGLSLSVLRFAS